MMSSELFATNSAEKEGQKRPRSSLISSGRGTLGMDSRMQSHVYTEGVEEEIDGKSRKLLMFHGIILRSQLTVLLKNKIFFDENDRVSCMHHTLTINHHQSTSCLYTCHSA